MRFRVDEISSVIGEEIQQYRQSVDLTETGKVLEVGDGIAQVYGLSNAMSGELIAFSNGSMGQVFNLEESSVGIVILGEYLGIKEGDEVRRTGELVSVPCGEAMIGRIVDPLGRPLDGLGVIETPASPSARVQGARHRPAPAGHRAAPDRRQGHRLDDSDRPRPARADHRRPQDRQDRDRDRRHHQPEGHRRHLRLRRHGPEGVDGRRPGREAPRARRHGLHHRGLCLLRRPGAAAVHRPVRRRRDGRVLHVSGRTRHARRLRRPFEAGGVVPSAVAAAAPAAGPRGIPRRRLLPPLPSPRALGEAARRVRRGGEGRAGGPHRSHQGGQAPAGARRPGRGAARRRDRPLPSPARQAHRRGFPRRRCRTRTSTGCTASRTRAAR